MESLTALQARAHFLLSRRLWQLGDFVDAETELDHALALMPDDAWRLRRAVMMPAIPESRRQIEQLRARMETRLQELLRDDLRIEDPVKQLDWTCFLLAYHGEHGNAHLQRLFHQVCSKACPGLDWVAPHIGAPRADGRLRVGFISWFFNDHTISRLFIGLIERLDRHAFDVSLFAFAGQDGYLQQADLAGKRIVILPTDLADARDSVAEARLDVLIYLDLGMDPLTLFLAHARLATTQALLWGHPDTTGLPSIDVFLTSDAMEAEDGERDYTERLVRLPGIATWISRPEITEERLGAEDFGLPKGCRFYLIPQTPQKFHPDFDDVIRRILIAQPTAHLVLTGGWQKEKMEILCRRISGPMPALTSRIHIMEALSRERFIALMRLADLLLDPPHYSGGHTTLEAFAYGVPIVTWPGRHMRARHTFGFYRLMGIKDCVAADLDDYVDIAIRLFDDRVMHDALRQRILKACHVLYESDVALQGFEAFLRSTIVASER